jgi:hypothetical protein
MATENVSILFTDIVDSTELSQRLSPEVADEVRRGHFSILRQAIAVPLRSTTGPEPSSSAPGQISAGDRCSQNGTHPGDAETARDLLTKSHATAAEHGYGNVERRAAAALQDLD